MNDLDCEEDNGGYGEVGPKRKSEDAGNKIGKGFDTSTIGGG